MLFTAGDAQVVLDTTARFVEAIAAMLSA